MFYKFFLGLAAYFFFITADVFPSVASSALNMIIYNVGQGNCISVNCPQGNSLLIDCGSSEHDDDRRSTEAGKPPIIDFERIKREIILLSQINPLTIFISHLDKDHYNLLDLIFDTPARRALISKVIIIGEESSLGTEVGDGKDRRQSKANLLGWILSLRAESKSVEFYNTYNDPNLLAAMPSCGQGHLMLLTSSVCNQPGFNHAHCNISNKTNANSLVLKLNHGTCSAILPGDALGVTADDIINRDPPIDYSATVSLMSHHGAILHDANSDRWLNGVNPKIIPISVGRNNGYGHPSCTVIKDVLSGSVAPQLFDHFEMHPLSCYTDFKPHEFEDGETSKGIISTFNFGDIHIDFNVDTDIDHVTLGDGEGSDLIENASCVGD